MTGSAGSSACKDDIKAVSDKLLSSLNPEQYEAVVSLERPLLVLSGAGTGKTKVLTTKIAYILENGFARPSQILAVTFTNKAACEMKTRLRSLICNVDDTWIGTFHYVCLKILREHSDKIGLNSDFRILEPLAQVRIMKQILRHFGIDMKKANNFMSKISLWKNNGYWCKSAHINRESDEGCVYQEYQQYILSQNCLDFDDLLLYTLLLFQIPEVLQMYQTKFKHLLVDEYQDTSRIQCQLIQKLFPTGDGLCCVGDDDQAIYGWRGADVENILNFQKDFKNAKIVRLERNYRSGKHIVNAAASLISHNRKRLGKTIRTDSDDGEKIIVKCCDSDFAEMQFVFNKIKALRAKMQYGDIAVLARSNSMVHDFKGYLTEHGVPCKLAEPDDITEVTNAKSGDDRYVDAVNLMTLHSAKGLEFNAVFLVGWKEYVFPSLFGTREGKLEEERRLAYVGLTRAKRHVYITYGKSRKSGQSQFICELSETIRI